MSGGSGSSFIPDTLRLSAYQPSATARKVVQLLPGFSTVDANGQSRVFGTSVVGGSNEPVPSGDSVVVTTRNDYELGASGNLLHLHTVDNFGRDEREYHHEFGFIDNLGNRTLFVRDMLGSVRATLKNGTMVEWNDYYAYGAVRDGKSLANGRWKYLGLEFDNETGSTHTAAREFFSLEGFFNKPDRFEFLYPAYSPYHYSKNNPFRYHDASGDSINTLINEDTPIPPWRIDPFVNPVDVYLTVNPVVALRQGSKALANFVVNLVKRFLKGDANETEMPVETTEPNQSKDIHSIYEDGTPVFEGDEPARLPSKGHAPKPDENAQASHSRLRWDEKNKRVYQSREFDDNGNPVQDIDFTVGVKPNTGKPRPNHNLPGVHKWTPNDVNHPKSGFKRSKKDEPLKK